jgi:hypothetical protein
MKYAIEIDGERKTIQPSLDHVGAWIAGYTRSGSANIRVLELEDELCDPAHR